MLSQLIKPSKALSKITLSENELSTDVNLDYNKSSLERQNDVTTIHIDRAVKGKGEVANCKTYSQNIVKKYELTGNKEVCLRKIFIAERTDSLFDVTIRELKMYYRKDKKQQFNKVIHFKTPVGTIEHIFDILKNQGGQKNITAQSNYLLN